MKHLMAPVSLICRKTVATCSVHLKMALNPLHMCWKMLVTCLVHSKAR